MISKSILWRYQVFVAAVMAGITLFSGNVSAAQEDVQRKTDWDGSEKYIVRASTALHKDYNPEDKITFIGCETQENYDKYMEALRSNESDDVLAGLRSENKCQVLSNASLVYYVKIKSMDEKTGKITQVMRDFDGIIDGPFFTNVTPDKRLVRHVPQREAIELLDKKFRDDYLARKKNKPFVTKKTSFVCRSFYDYGKQRYDYKSKSSGKSWFDIVHQYENEGRCFDIDKGTEIEVIFENRYLDVEYKVLSGEHKGKFVYADDNVR